MDRYLIRPYTGKGVGFVAEVVIFTDKGDLLSVIPVTARKAIQDGQELIARGASVLLR